MSLVSEPVEGGVAKSGKVLGGVAAFDGAAVLAEGFIADVVGAVFDGSPVVADERFERGCVGSGSRERRDVVSGLGRRHAADGAFTNDLAHLLHAGPADVVRERCRGGQCATFDAAMPFVQRADAISIDGPFAKSVGGLDLFLGSPVEVRNSREISRNNAGWFSFTATR